MAKTAVALYQTVNDARHVVEELATSGYNREDIQMMDQDDGNSVTTLTRAGLPQVDAEAYREGLQHGAHLVMLTSTDDMIDAAVYIMESYNSINIHDRQAPWQINGAEQQQGNATYGRDALQRDADATELPLVEEGIRYEEYPAESGTVRAEGESETSVAQENIPPRQDYVEESIRR